MGFSRISPGLIHANACSINAKPLNSTDPASSELRDVNFYETPESWKKAHAVEPPGDGASTPHVRAGSNGPKSGILQTFRKRANTRRGGNATYPHLPFIIAKKTHPITPPQVE